MVDRWYSSFDVYGHCLLPYKLAAALHRKLFLDYLPLSGTPLDAEILNTWTLTKNKEDNYMYLLPT
jgi:hypothetical protein